MASKEFTVFVIDLSPSMGEYCPKKRTTDFEFGMKYFYNHVSDLILKERKQDRVGVVLCHSPVTKNAYFNEDSLNNIEVIYKNEQFTYMDFKECSKRLVVNQAPIKSNEGDCLEASLVGVGLFKDTAKYKLTRNLIIITNANTPVTTFNSKLADATVSAITNMDINVHLICVDSQSFGNSPVKKENVKNWIKLMELYKGKFSDAYEINRDILYFPPLKKVRPVSTFQGNLRFGSALDEHTSLPSNNDDSNSNISLDVQVFPAIKTERIPPSHQYIVNGDVVDSIGDEITYYIKNSNQKSDIIKEEDNEEFEKQIISKGEWDDGFKYSNMDMIALDKELLSSTKLPIQIGMDIYGFIKRENLPFAYFTKEASYVIPNSDTTKRNLTSFNALCQSLIDLKTVALVRYVPNQNKDVETCALLPHKFNIKKGLVYGFILIRLAFKEDEKIGRFPNLTSITSTSGNTANVEPALKPSENRETDKINKLKSLLPSSKANDLMESFINSKTLNNYNQETINDFTLKNPKLSLFESEKMILSHPDWVEFNDKFLVPSPAIQKFNTNLKKIIIKSLKEDNMHKFLNDTKFIEKVLVSSPVESDESIRKKIPTNLFNIYNIFPFDKRGEEIAAIDSKSQKFARELTKELDIKIIRVEKTKKHKNEDVQNELLYNNNKKPNYGRSEGEYDEIIDLNKLLG